MNVGLIAQDTKKKLMQNFCIAYHGILNKHKLFATGSTGRLIEDVTGLTIHKYLGGELGGAEQFANQIAENDLDLVIFFKDTVFQRNYPNAFDTKKIMMLCDQYSVPLATNLATAELLIKSLDYGDLEWREVYRS
ncbi:MAG: methylglyoxal synthase [Lachnospiraceae bacterium]|nr:methylglyoxal synthase [Lachnospiraceae bacterium]